MDYLLTPNSIPDMLEECMNASELKGVTLAQAYPDAPVDVPTIIWSVYRRVKGKEGHERKKPRQRGGSTALTTSTLIDYWGQWETIIYQFDFFHATNVEVDKLMAKWESFVIEATPSLINIGIDTFLFDEQLKDYSLPVPRELPQRSLRYEATFTVYRPVYVPRIRQISRYILVNFLDREDNAQTLQVTRGDSDIDTVPVIVSAITTVADVSGSTQPDYIAGVDFELTVAEDGHQTQITWTRAGKRPVAQANYYVMHSDPDASYYQTIF